MSPLTPQRLAEMAEHLTELADDRAEDAKIAMRLNELFFQSKTNVDIKNMINQAEACREAARILPEMIGDQNGKA